MTGTPKGPCDPDTALMVAFQQGDEGAFEQILDKYHKAIVNFIYKIVNNRAEAEELAQDVFLKVYRARLNYEPRARFSAWIYRIATNVGLKAAGRKRRSPFGFGPDAGYKITGEEGRAREPDAEQTLVTSELGKVVRQVIRGLPRNEKIAIILRRYEGLSYKEIAEVMNCTEPAVKTYIHRGKLRLRDRIRPYLRKGKA
jgi:RNA polymerase sigma-70 factor (ECF subfamily)